MKHNICNLVLYSLFSIFMSQQIQAKVVSSEFFNQATYGSEGPQITELEIEGRSIYLLKYLYKNKLQEVKTISKEEFLKIQNQMHTFIDLSLIPSSANKNACERELIYSKVDFENRVSVQSLCWQDINATNRMDMSQWISNLQKKFLL